MKKLLLPGSTGADAHHWLTRWAALDTAFTRVDDLTTLDAHLTESSVLIAHGDACHLAARARKNVAALMLVAPTKSRSAPAQLPFPAVVVASRDDDFAYAETFAAALGASLVDAAAGSVGSWPEGRATLRALLSVLPFSLDHRLKNDTFLVGESDLNLLLLLNDTRYVWFMLVPKRGGVEDVHQLAPAERAQLHDESHALSVALERAFTPDKLNVASLGNFVRQLHVHHVVRRFGDAAWPGPVWGHSPRVPYQDESWRDVVSRLFAVDARWRR